MADRVALERVGRVAVVTLQREDKRNAIYAAAGSALEVALEIAQTIAANAPVAVSETLKAVAAVLAGDDEIGWEATMRAQEAVLASEDLVEGINPFFERRAPQWRGR